MKWQQLSMFGKHTSSQDFLFELHEKAQDSYICSAKVANKTDQHKDVLLTSDHGDVDKRSGSW